MDVFYKWQNELVFSLKGVPLWWAPALLTNIRLDWKGLLGTTPLGYLFPLLVTKKKSFSKLTLEPNVIKLFTFVNYGPGHKEDVDQH